MKLRRRLALTLLVTSLAACTPWTRVDPTTRSEQRHGDFALDLPVGWVRNNATRADAIFITRDGPALNYILVVREPHGKKLGRIKRETRPDMLPHELAEMAIAEWKSHEATANLEVVSNTPTRLDGRPAVRVHIRYKNDRGLPIDRLLVALVDTRGRLTLLYEAPAIVYFQRGLPDFEAMVASLRLPPQ